jgi:HlyD family secretion protein
MKRIILLIVTGLTVVLGSCKEKAEEADAWGNFEVLEVMIASESAGRIINISAPEGQIIEKGGRIALTDTVMLHLQKNELSAAMNTISSKVAALRAQNDIMRQQITNLEVNINRVKKMVDDQAAPIKQLDDLTGQKSVLETQIKANNAQVNAVEAEKNVLKAKLSQLDEQISRCTLLAPSRGTIIERYAEEGEITAPGKPVAKLADLTIMKLKVYISGAQLGIAVPGASCRIRVDEGANDYRYYDGTITIVSSKAEFTPKIIQTKEERVSLVYAVTIEVLNDGFIRTGMPGEAIFSKLTE